MTKNKILVVEDDAAIALNLGDILLHNGFETVLSNSGEEALEIINEQPIFLVLMDISLAGKLDGIETAAQINEITDIPIIYLSAYTDKELFERAQKTNPFAFLVKPYKERELVNNIEIASYNNKLKKNLEHAQAIARTGSFEWDLATDQIIWSKELYKILGLNRQTYSPKPENFVDFVHPEDKHYFSFPKEPLKPISKIGEFKCRIIDQTTGVIKHVILKYEARLSPTGEPEFVFGTIQDISEQKTKEEQLKRLDSVITQSPASVVITNIEGTIDYVNPKFETLTGYSSKEVIGKNPKILKSGKNSKQFYEKLWEKISEGNEWRGEFINKKKNGELFWESATIFPIKNDAGKIISFAKVAQDITTEKILQERLNQKQKMESLGILSAGMAHQINTPLSVIKLHTKMALKEFESKNCDEVQEHMNYIEKNSTKISKVIEKFLNFSQKDDQTQICNLNNTIKDITSLLKNEFLKHKIKLDLELEPLPSISIDETKIEQAFLNIIINAMQSSTPNSTVKIETRTVKVDKSYIEVTFKDFGKGMDKKTRENIFEPFFTTKGESGGTGLGLYICWNIVKSYQGIILVDSKIGTGTTFKIILPTVRTNEKKL